jgi:hypothetical protein
LIKKLKEDNHDVHRYAGKADEAAIASMERSTTSNIQVDGCTSITSNILMQLIGD